MNGAYLVRTTICISVRRWAVAAKPEFRASLDSAIIINATLRTNLTITSSNL